MGKGLVGAHNSQQGRARGGVQVCAGPTGFHDVSLRASEAVIGPTLLLDHGSGPLQYAPSPGSSYLGPDVSQGHDDT